MKPRASALLLAAILVLFPLPACARMKPVIDDIIAENERLTVHTLEVSGNMENRIMLLDAVRAFAIERLSVPAVFLGDRVWIGYGETAVRQIREEVTRCLDEGCVDTFEIVAAALAVNAPEAPARTAEAGSADVPTLFGVSADELPLVGYIAIMDHLIRRRVGQGSSV